MKRTPLWQKAVDCDIQVSGRIDHWFRKKLLGEMNGELYSQQTAEISKLLERTQECYQKAFDEECCPDMLFEYAAFLRAVSEPTMFHHLICSVMDSRYGLFFDPQLIRVGTCFP